MIDTQMLVYLVYALAVIAVAAKVCHGESDD